MEKETGRKINGIRLDDKELQPKENKTFKSIFSIFKKKDTKSNGPKHEYKKEGSAVQEDFKGG